jgi:hypothetical protein
MLASLRRSVENPIAYIYQGNQLWVYIAAFLFDVLRNGIESALGPGEKDDFVFFPESASERRSESMSYSCNHCKSCHSELSQTITL